MRLKHTKLMAGTASLYLALVVAAAGTTPAQADTYPATLLPRDSNHTYCYSGYVRTEERSVYYYAMDTVRATTDLSVEYKPTCSSYTDIFWSRNGGLPPGTRGRWTCQQVYGNSMCSRASIQLDFTELRLGDDDWYDERKTAVHEAGHSLGFNHDSSSAMISGEVPNRDLQWRRYSAHDLSHVNGRF